MGDNQWAYKRPSGQSYREYLARIDRSPTFWNEGHKWMEKKEWPVAFSYADEELEKRYRDWTDKELISTAGYLMQEHVSKLEEDLKSIKAVVSSHLYELERRIRCRNQNQSQSQEQSSQSKSQSQKEQKKKTSQKQKEQKDSPSKTQTS